MRFYYPESNYKNEDFCGFEPVKMHCKFMYITNAFKIRFDVISNALGNKGDRIILYLYIIQVFMQCVRIESSG